ncbi:hypothetical protein [Defluviimonas sp. SAOS-178_SWC]|uniref:hypothetical protein n=1 Tax=Defluviimonas sp. SAOS-178_SWC TaxID=3121287 RepID=UPI0032219A8B
MKHAPTVAAMMMPTFALAHSGDHHAEGIGSLVAHAFSEPDHALLLALVVAAPIAVWIVARRRG